MRVSEARALVAKLAAAYPGREFPESTEALYVEMLRDLPFAEGLRAVNGLIATSRFLPTIAEIREVASSHPLPEEAWRDAVKVACAMWDGVRHVPPPEWADPVVLRAVEVIGVDVIRLSWADDL